MPSFMPLMRTSRGFLMTLFRHRVWCPSSTPLILRIYPHLGWTRCWLSSKTQTPVTGTDKAMVDVLTPDQRRLNMRRIRSGNTKPEMMIRQGLHSRGFRFRLHCRNLPGRPDIVFPRYRAVIMVHGCFWHGHDCPHFKLPATRPEFWSAKILW